MKLVATLEIALFYLTAFGARSVVQWRRTGATGFVGVRPGARALERLAAGVLGVVLVLAPVAPWVGEPLWSRGHAAGSALAAAGLALTLLAQVQLGASWRIGVDPAERTTLVTSGLFSLVRNPIFSAMVLVAGGLALAAPTPLAVALPPLLVAALELQVRLVEEPHLLETHGEPYRAWASRTGRFVPCLGRLDPEAAGPGAGGPHPASAPAPGSHPQLARARPGTARRGTSRWRGG